jgi:RNA polymerase sigma factor (sigma-70 family)
MDPMSSFANQPAADAGPDQMAAARIEQLYSSHAALVRSICRSLLRNPVDAEDAVQQTFLSAQRAFLSGSAPRDAAAWLATIARHESFARVRSRMREPLPINTELEATGPDAHAVAVHRHEVSELRAALEELPAQQRQALLLREVRGLSYEEVASTLSVTTSTVESLLFRARRNVQARLRDALATFSPGALVREFAARLGGGFVAPAATKALAVGVGAAVVTGGAVVGPRIIGLGHAPRARPTASAGTVHHDSRGGTLLDMPSRFGVRLGAGPIAGDAPTPHESGDHPSQGGLAPGPESPDQGETPGRASSDGGSDSSPTSDSGGSGSSDSAGMGSGDIQTTSSGNDSTTTDSSSQTTQTTTTSSGSNDSGGTTTTSGPGGD